MLLYVVFIMISSSLLANGQLGEIPADTVINGLIEGFYWPASESVNGVYNSFTNAQRNQLIASISPELKFYFYGPAETETTNQFSMKLWNAETLASWTDTALRAKKAGVTLVYGIRPWWIENVQETVSTIKQKLAQLASANIGYYMLCWDDAGGAGSDSQMTAQRDLVNLLMNQVTDVRLLAVIPAYYSRMSVSPATTSEWANKLSILHQIPSSVRFIVTGNEINPWSISPTDVPSPLTNRQFIFFDNWIASDTNTRIGNTWPPNRSPEIFRASQSTSGCVLNLNYPPERIIHQVYAMKQRANQSTSIDNAKAATFWTQYLINNKYYTFSDKKTLNQQLKSLLDSRLEIVNEIAAKYPFLAKIFIN